MRVGWFVRDAQQSPAGANGVPLKKHIASLDGLRGIAILLVFLFHYLPRDYHDPLAPVASVGWAGVDLFFVLSGFLITGILYDTRTSSNFFRVFYWRRALRLFPVYFLAVAVVVVGTKFFYGSHNWLLIPFFVYGANIVRPMQHALWFFPPYFDCGHFWSLALEEQFYSIWPLMVFFIPSRRTLMQVCLGGIVFAVLLRIILAAAHASPWFAYCELPARMDSLLAGALLALALRGPLPEKWLKPARLWWILTGAFMLFAVVLGSARSLFFLSMPMRTVGYTVLALISTCTLALALVPGTIISRIGGNALLRFFGRYSYGLYIWHYLFTPLCLGWRKAFRSVIPNPTLSGIVFTLAMLAMFTAISVLSYRLFEIHFLRLKSRFVADSRSQTTVAG